MQPEKVALKLRALEFWAKRLSGSEVSPVQPWKALSNVWAPVAMANRSSGRLVSPVESSKQEVKSVLADSAPLVSAASWVSAVTSSSLSVFSSGVPHCVMPMSELLRISPLVVLLVVRDSTVPLKATSTVDSAP